VAVAKDAATGSQADGTTTFTWSHTCTGTDLVLFVSFSDSSGVGTPTVTYNGVSMTKDSTAPYGGNGSTLFYLINPATGANNVVVASATAGNLQGCSFSVTGAKQTGVPYTLTTANAGSGTHSGTATLSGFGIAFESSGAGISTPNQTNGDIQNNDAGSGVSNYACQSAAASGSTTFTWADNADQWFMLLLDVLPSTAAAPGRATRMVEYIKQVGTVTNTTGATTSVITVAAGGVSVGDTVIVLSSADNSGTNGAIQASTISDTRGNTWNYCTHGIADPGLANAGNEGFIAWARINVALQASDSITISWPTSTAAKAVRADAFRNVGMRLGQITQDNQTGTSSSVALEATGVGQLIVGAVCVEGGTADTFTQDADTTNGAWVNPGRLGSGTTTSGATLNPIYKIVTAAGVQTYNPTMGTSRDHCAVLALFECLPYDSRKDAGPARRELRKGMRRR
jgi:hypothetical protein